MDVVGMYRGLTEEEAAPRGSGKWRFPRFVKTAVLAAFAVAKLLRPHQAKVPAARAHLEREGLLALRLRHPHLAHGYALCLDGQYPHLLLEYAEGPTLRRLVRRHGPLAPEQWLPLAAHLASVLQYLHNEEVVHLDVKPANVVVGLAPRLVDLGIARSFEAAARLRDPIGSEAWMAPEQCDPTAAGGVGPAADVWGLGATLHYALAGEPPFPRRLPDGPFPQLEGPPRPLPAHVPGAMRELVTWMLRADPRERPAPCQVAEALEPIAPKQRRF